MVTGLRLGVGFGFGLVGLGLGESDGLACGGVLVAARPAPGGTWANAGGFAEGKLLDTR